MAIYYSDNELSRMFEVDFHREIKPFIIKDARLSGDLKKLKANNPDIGIEDDSIYLRDPRNHKKWIKTDLNINNYI